MEIDRSLSSDPDTENVAPNGTTTIEIEPYIHEFYDSTENPFDSYQNVLNSSKEVCRQMSQIYYSHDETSEIMGIHNAKKKSNRQSLRLKNHLIDSNKFDKNEYARRQMKLYRQKIKSDPERYKIYLANERLRNRKRKEKRIESLMLEGKSLEEAMSILKMRKLPGESIKKYRKKKSTSSTGLQLNQNHTNLSIYQNENPMTILLKAIERSGTNNLFPINPENMRKKRLVEETAIKARNTEMLEDAYDEDNENEQDIKFNRICCIFNCPSRNQDLNQDFENIQYYPFPSDKEIQKCWIDLIKSKTKQRELDLESFICSIHFAKEWFGINELYDDEMLNPKAVPTLFPDSNVFHQFDTEIPDIYEIDLQDSDNTKNMFKWFSRKLKEKDHQLTEQLKLIENQNEEKIVQTKRLVKAAKNFHKTLLPELREQYLKTIFEQLAEMETKSLLGSKTF